MSKVTKAKPVANVTSEVEEPVNGIKKDIHSYTTCCENFENSFVTVNKEMLMKQLGHVTVDVMNNFEKLGEYLTMNNCFLYKFVIVCYV